MAISAGGLGSGLDVNGIVSQLMALERKPLNLLQKQVANLGNELSAYGKLKSALSSFESAVTTLTLSGAFGKFSATSSDTTNFTATADTTASAAIYNIDVVKLAQAHKVYATGTYAAEQGSFNITSGTNTFGVTIGATNNTLSGIRDAINSASGNTSVSASIIKDAGVDKLILTAKNTGAANAISATDTSGTVAATLNFATVTGFAAQDAQIKVDGFTINNATNTVTGAITGVTLNLSKATTTTQTLTVGRDLASAKGDIQKFVDAYNGLAKTLTSLGGKTGALSSDRNTLLSIEQGVRRVLNTAASGLSFKNLSDIGISAQTDGTLKLDAAKLDSQITANLTGVADLFSNATQGFAVRLKSTLQGYTSTTDGLIAGREKGINASIVRNTDRQADLERRMVAIERRYKAQFTALDTLMSKLQSTGNYLTQQLASLPGASQ